MTVLNDSISRLRCTEDKCELFNVVHGKMGIRLVCAKCGRDYDVCFQTQITFKEVKKDVGTEQTNK